MVVVSLVIIISLLAVISVQSVKNHKSEVPADFKSVMSPRLLLFAALMMSCDLICGGDLHARLLFDLMLSLFPMLIISDSLKSHEPESGTYVYFCVAQVVMSVYYIMCFLDLLPMFSARIFMTGTSLTALAVISVFYAGIWNRLREVKAVMKSGSVWSFVCICVDFIYMSVPVAVMAISLCLDLLLPHTCSFHYLLAIILLFAELMALALRVIFDSRFVLLQKQENLIVESMKISQIEVFGSNNEDEQYKDIYERVVLLFEMEKPFLKGELTINDIVKVVFSNKVYISRAISHYTGRNFRQFVNYHRVMYSMELFRSRPDLKVAELSALSGFNTVVSFTMAFRLFVNETPSEWCRKERTKLLKTKK